MRFFADEKALEQNYVIPLRMTEVQGADSILEGKAAVGDPVLTNNGHWSVQPKEFYSLCSEICKSATWEYLRRGVDKAVINGVSYDKVRHKQYVENDERVYVTTKSLKDNILSLSTEDAGGTLFNYDVRLSFADDGTCTVGSVSDDLTVSGTGKFVKDGEKE